MQQLNNAQEEQETDEECLHFRECFLLFLYVAKATTEMERSGIEVRCAVFVFACSSFFRKCQECFTEKSG